MAASRSVDIIYVPADCGSVIPGKSKAPKAFQEVGIARKLREAGLPSVSERDALKAPAEYSIATFEPGRIRNESLNVSVCEQVHQALTRSLEASDSTTASFQLILGGECCMSPAILSALWHYAASLSPPKRVGLLYIDADLDLSSPTDPDSTGIFAGMNTTHLVRAPGALKSMEQFSRPNGEPVCDGSNTVFFGANMLHPGNKPQHLAYLFENNYHVISAASVQRDPEQYAAQALEYLQDIDTIFVHLDVDSIDPLMFPLANVPNYTGVTFDSMMRALKVILSSDKIGGLTIAEVNPDHDPGLNMVEQLTNEVVGMLASRHK